MKSIKNYRVSIGIKLPISLKECEQEMIKLFNPVFNRFYYDDNCK